MQPLHQCPSCQYDLTGIAGDICPECGSDVVEYKQSQTAKKHAGRANTVVVACVLATFVIGGWFALALQAAYGVGLYPREKPALVIWAAAAAWSVIALLPLGRRTDKIARMASGGFAAILFLCMVPWCLWVLGWILASGVRYY